MLTEGPQPDEIVTERSAHMAEIGSKGGRKGGRLRSAKLSPEQRSTIAKKAAKARWSA